MDEKKKLLLLLLLAVVVGFHGADAAAGRGMPATPSDGTGEIGNARLFPEQRHRRMKRRRPAASGAGGRRRPAGSPRNATLPSTNTTSPPPPPHHVRPSPSPQPPHHVRPSPSPKMINAMPVDHRRPAHGDLPIATPLTAGPETPPVVISQPKRSPSAPLIASIVLGAGAAVAASAAVLILCRVNKGWETLTVGFSGQLQKALTAGALELKRSELEAACEDFSNVIGSSAEHTVYKGTLSTGAEIAVIATTASSTKEWPTDCETQFTKKVAGLSKFNHKNFLNLVGFCSGDRPFTRMIVFEYAPNGTLFEHLHVDREEEEAREWQVRMRIAMGIAYCLEEMDRSDVLDTLTDLSSSTIHLTADFAAKVSDSFSFSNNQGSEEAVTRKYGILLLELLTGRIPASTGGALERWARRFVDGETPLLETIRPGMRPEEMAIADAIGEVIRSCIEPEKPLTMAEVTRKMREITGMPPESAAPKDSPLWWAELEVLSSAD